MLVGKRADDRFDLIASRFTWNTSKCKFLVAFVACVRVSKEEDGLVQIEGVSVNYLQCLLGMKFNHVSPL